MSVFSILKAIAKGAVAAARWAATHQDQIQQLHEEVTTVVGTVKAITNQQPAQQPQQPQDPAK